MSTKYQVFLLDGADRFLLMDSGLPTGPRLSDPVIVEEPNAAPSLRFTITVDHPLFDSLTIRNTWLEVREQGKSTPERFRVLDAESTSDAVTEITTEGVLAVFNDTIQPHVRFDGKPSEWIDLVLANHNAQAVLPNGSPDPMRQIVRGFVDDSLDSNARIIRSVGGYPYPSTMEILKRSTWDSTAGGVVRIYTGTDGVNYLDWLSAGALSTQVIRWGGTLQDWRRSMSSVGIITACEPAGAELDTDEELPANQARPRLVLSASDEADLLYTDAQGIGHYGAVNQAAQAVHGLVVASAVWDDVTTPAMLKRRAAEFATTHSLTQVSIDAAVVDQHLLDPSITQLSVSERVRLVIPPLGLDQQLTVARRQRSLVDASKWKVELGAKQSTIGDAINKGVRAADQVNEVVIAQYKINETMQSVTDLSNGAAATARAAQTTASKAAEAAGGAKVSADAAAKKAAEAAGVAGGKADILIQDGEPDQKYRRPTTLWIDTTGGRNTPKVWSDKAWIVRTDRAAVDAAAAAAKAQTSANNAATAATAARAAADVAWVAAQQGNLIKDSTFATTSATDHVLTGVAGGDVAAGVLVFGASGFTGVVPSPASSYAQTTGRNNYYFRGVNGGGEGLPTSPGRTYRLSIDVGYAGGGDHPFGFRVCHRVGGVWEYATGSDVYLPSAGQPVDTRFTRFSWEYTVGEGVDGFRPGFGSYVASGVDSIWWVTNFTVVDVTETQFVTSTVKTVQSKIDQLPDQVLLQVQQRYVTTTAMSETTEDWESRFKQSAEDFELSLTKATKQVTDLGDRVVADAAELHTVFRFDSTGIVIGRSDSPTVTQFRHDGMVVRVGGGEVARFTDGGAVVPKLRVGNRIVEASANGGVWMRRVS
ncbi:MAG: phage tail protein [Propionibacteriaceae bacterium]|jgi:hypothetical protein|nr:phage tail protein [Propionibacteriaceae bacterium]